MASKEPDSYEAIKTAALLAYFDFCRERGHVLGQSHAQILDAVAYEFENAYQATVEQLMFQVALLVLSAGMHETREAELRTRIEARVRALGLANVLREVPPTAAEAFKRDLRVFGLI